MYTSPKFFQSRVHIHFSLTIFVQPKVIAQTTVQQQQQQQQRLSNTTVATATVTAVENTQTELTHTNVVIDMVPASWLTQESRSAPELSSINLKEHNEFSESCSDSYTSTCTTTTTTSEEYQRMYNAQSMLQSSQMYYDQSSTDLNSSNCDYEVVSIQQQQGSFSSGSTDLILVSSSGRRSTQECCDSICNTINTSQLVEYIKGSTPSFDDGHDAMPMTSVAQPKIPKRVEFSENIIKVETDALINSGSQPSSVAGETNEQLHQEQQQSLDEQIQQYQATTTIVEQQPQKPTEVKGSTLISTSSVVYNPTPKEWSSLMCQALTTASPKPFTLADVPETVIIESNTSASATMTNTHIEQFSEQQQQQQSTIKVCEFVSEKKSHEEELDKEVQSVLPEKADDERKPDDDSAKSEEPTKNGLFATATKTNAPNDSMEWFKPVYENVPLPEETTPYFPPNIPLLPIEKHEPLQRKSPFVDALTTAPLRPFTPFENDVISQIEGLPRQAGSTEIKLIEALTTAPAQPVSELNAGKLPDETEAERIARLEQEKREKEAAEVRELISKTIDTELSRKRHSFAPLSGFRRVDPFKPPPPPPSSSLSYTSQSPHQSRASSVCTECIVEKSRKSIDSTSTTTIDHAQTIHKACHHHNNNNSNSSNNHKDQSNRCNTKRSATAFPPPSGTPVKSYVQSGLHSPSCQNMNHLPRYQRQWFNLPSQSPMRTPEPIINELKENIPLAFLDVPHEHSDSISKPIAVTISASTSTTASATNESAQMAERTTTSDLASVSSISVTAVKETAVEMAKSSTTATTLQSSAMSSIAVPTIVPTLPVENRAGPITMTFQSIDPKDIIAPARSITPSLINKAPPMVPYYQKNLVCEYYSAPDSHTFEPMLGRTPSPHLDASKPFAQGPPASVLKIQAPRITVGDNAQVLASTRSGFQSSAHSFATKPEVFHREQKGANVIETHTTGTESNDARKSGMTTSSTVQIGNMQVQQNRRVVEEFEHTQKSSTTEIQTSSCSTNTNQLQQQKQQITSQDAFGEMPYGKGFVARQARRISETPMSSKNVIASYRFPQTVVDYTDSGFPLFDSQLPKECGACDEKPCVMPCEKPCNLPCTTPKLACTPTTLSTPKPISCSTLGNRCSPQPRTISPRAFSPKPPTSPKPPQKMSFPPPIDVAAYDAQFSGQSSYDATNTMSSASLTQQYQSSSAITSAYKTLTAGSTSAFLPTTNLNYGSNPQPQTSTTSIPGTNPPPSNFNNNNYNNNNQNTTVSVSDPTPASAGTSSNNIKSLTSSATSSKNRLQNKTAPNRGRGVLNASAPPGARIPKCGCCGEQIR